MELWELRQQMSNLMSIKIRLIQSQELLVIEFIGKSWLIVIRFYK
jgi:hypothetical protein